MGMLTRFGALDQEHPEAMYKAGEESKGMLRPSTAKAAWLSPNSGSNKEQRLHRRAPGELSHRRML